MNRRTNIEIPGIEHANPIPAACRIGSVLVSSGIFGRDPQTGKAPDDIEGQAANVFANIRRIMETAGGSIDDIIKIGFWVRDAAYRSQINEEWLAMFPEDHNRPARHTFIAGELIGNTLVQCEIMAVLKEYPE